MSRERFVTCQTCRTCKSKAFLGIVLGQKLQIKFNNSSIVMVCFLFQQIRQAFSEALPKPVSAEEIEIAVDMDREETLRRNSDDDLKRKIQALQKKSIN